MFMKDDRLRAQETEILLLLWAGNRIGNSASTFLTVSPSETSPPGTSGSMFSQL